MAAELDLPSPGSGSTASLTASSGPVSSDPRTASSAPGGALKIACRPSPLAVHQAEVVAGIVERGGGPPCEIVKISTRGDAEPEVAISRLGGRGVFVKEVQAAVLRGHCDAAVHSAKDLPPEPTEGLNLAAFPPRGDPRDCLVGSALDDLDPGAEVATGSVRRRAQLAALRPDLLFVELRGNIATRLERVPDGGAVVVALAALQRLGLEGRVAEILDTHVMLPQVGQGALAVECRCDDEQTLAALQAVDDRVTRDCVEAERSFLAGIGGSCDLPVGAYARSGATGLVELEAMVAAGDGRIVVRHVMSGHDPLSLGRAMSSHMIDTAGLGELLGLEGGLS